MKSIISRVSNRLIRVAILSGLILPFIVSSTGRFVGPSVAEVRITPAISTSPNSDPKEKIQSQIQNDESLVAAIRDARYSVERTEDTYHAANPANRMRAAFEHPGNFMLRGSNDDDSWQSEWRLKSIGHGSVQQRVLKGEWTGSQTKIAANHWIESADGPIRVEESFENRPDGLEQVFVVEKSPRSLRTDDRSRLRLVLEINGDLEARASDDGQTIDLINQNSEKILRYEKLKVWDANSRALNARMRTKASSEVWLEVDDADAVYPITVDPSFVQTQKLTRPDSAAGDEFGESLAFTAGPPNVLAIGAPGADVAGNLGQGAVYLFEYSKIGRAHV